VQLDTALPWLALCLPRGIAARLLKQFGSLESVFRAPLRQLEGCELTAATAQAILKKDDIVEATGLNSSDVLATLFDLEMKGLVRQLPGKQFRKILL
jgi:predicted Rossmann fold nucleotide-binding protein DprA/Smf involved in DNA uptake